jgi:hypothetical protein
MRRYLRSSTEAAKEEAAALLSLPQNEGNLEDAREEAPQRATPGAQSHEATSQSGSCHGTLRRAKVPCLRGRPKAQGFRV